MLSLLIPEAAKKTTLARLAKIAKKAGVTVTPLAGTTTLIVPPVGSEKRRRVLECSRVEVGMFPRMNGWSFVARLEHTAAGNLIACAFGEGVDESWRTATALCEHCNTVRNRRDTFVLRGTNGESKQIGRNCLADFLMVDATSLVHQAELVRTIGQMSDPDHESFGRGHSDPETDEFLACVVSSVESFGFVKSGSECSTKNDAEFLCGPCPNPAYAPEAAATWKAHQPTEAHEARAKMIRAWGAELSQDDTRGNDYLWNVHLACKLLGCDLRRYAGVLASVPAAYDRAMGVIRERAQATPAKESKHVGTLGKRETFEVTFSFRAGYMNDFGGGIICNFVDADGNQIVWFTSGACPGEADLQKKLRVTGTVKKHGDRKGQAQTVISRCKWEVIG